MKVNYSDIAPLIVRQARTQAGYQFTFCIGQREVEVEEALPPVWKQRLSQSLWQQFRLQALRAWSQLAGRTIFGQVGRAVGQPLLQAPTTKLTPEHFAIKAFERLRPQLEYNTMEQTWSWR